MLYVILIFGGFVILAAYYYLGLLPIQVADERRHSQREAIAVCTVVGWFFWPAWVIALIWAHTENNRKTIAFDVKAVVPQDGPGRYTLVVMDQETHEETTKYVDATSKAGAMDQVDGLVVKCVRVEDEQGNRLVGF